MKKYLNIDELPARAKLEVLKIDNKHGNPDEGDQSPEYFEEINEALKPYKIEVDFDLGWSVFFIQTDYTNEIKIVVSILGLLYCILIPPYFNYKPLIIAHLLIAFGLFLVLIFSILEIHNNSKKRAND